MPFSQPHARHQDLYSWIGSAESRGRSSLNGKTSTVDIISGRLNTALPTTVLGMSGCQVQVSGAAPSKDRVQKSLCHFKSLHRGTDCSTPAVAIDFQRNEHVDPLTTFHKFLRISPHYCEFHFTPVQYRSTLTPCQFSCKTSIHLLSQRVDSFRCLAQFRRLMALAASNSFNCQSCNVHGYG